jgi:hypothetical protein
MTNYELYIALMKIRIMFDEFFNYEANQKEIIMAFKVLKSNIPAFTFVEDDSIVECRRCKEK